MLASELIIYLQEMVRVHGDAPVFIYKNKRGPWRSEIKITGTIFDANGPVAHYVEDERK